MSSSPAGTLQALMGAAQDDPEARNQALSLLRRAPLHACTWPADPSQIRTLTNSGGVTALPVFTDEQQLHEAAIQYGWLSVDGSLPSTVVSIADAVNYARRSGISLIVLDLVADHTLELDDGDMELLAAVSRTSGRQPSNRGLSRVSTGAPPAQAPAAATGTPIGRRPRRHSSHTHLRPASVAPPAASGTVSATFGGSSQAGIQPLTDAVSEALTDALSDVLRDYPEVEWACLVRANRGGPGESAPAVGLRVEPNFRKHLNEIIVKLREAGIQEGATLDVLLLDDPEVMRQARSEGTPFYPWKK